MTSSIRITLLQPRPKARSEARRVLAEMDRYLAGAPGLAMSFTFESEAPDGYLGRIAVWDDEAAANRLARSEHALALRAQLQDLASGPSIETLAEISTTSGPEGLMRRILPSSKELRRTG